MSNQYTVDNQIASMKLRGFLPVGSGLSTNQILQLMSEEAGLYIPALYTSIRQEYGIVSLDISVTSSTVPVPSRATGAALRMVEWLNTDGTTYQLTSVSPERAPSFGQSGGQATNYWWQGNNLKLVPAQTSGTLRVSYQQRPGRFVLPEACGEVTAIDTGTHEVVLSSVPSNFSSSALYDLVSAVPNFTASAIDQAATLVGSILTFASLPATLAVGDFVCLAGQTCIPPFPTELHTVLAQRTAEKIAEATGSARLGAIQMGLAQARADAIAILTPRDQGSPAIIVRRHGFGRRGSR